MRVIIVLALLLPSILQAQIPRIKNKKYQGLLWEITGNGLKKPSYLFGTMHVSNKVAFHLADSFYLGIRSADVVALETNPETWQDDMDKYNNALLAAEKTAPSDRESSLSDYLRMSTLRFYKYDKKIEAALQSSPSTINSLLYRSYSNSASDFEEDTYLDLYIYQCGKRWGKKVAGVEDYDESMLLMAEAYRDAYNDKTRKQPAYDREGGFTSDRLQESYRTGNLDWLDSINRYNSTSAAFDEKFLYKRNEIQANSIDSIIRKGFTLFVGVGAAHLPGDRGVIEMLRAKGYKLRAVHMGTRDSEHKGQVEKLRVPVQFKTWHSKDGQFQVDIPGNLFEVGEEAGMQQQQYADMANGSYYMVTRIMTNAWLWNHSASRVLHIVDSLLYENIPGKILSKKEITVNGYNGYDIVNRTRRGDVQRYQIISTPFELMIFKLSGTGDYVTNGDEADRFFGSIRLKNDYAENWLNYSPPYGGFSISLPHKPYTGNDGSWIFDAVDVKNNTQYRVIRTDINNHFFAGQDTFDLGLMEESFAASEFIEKRISRKNMLMQGYPALDAVYKDKAGKILRARYIIQGAHYYTLVARSVKAIPATDKFFQSFRITGFQYSPSVKRADTAMYYTANSPFFPEMDSGVARMPIIKLREVEQEKEIDREGEISRSRILANDSTGEKIYISFKKSDPYISPEKISEEYSEGPGMGFDSVWIVRKRQRHNDAAGFDVQEWQVSDTGSSRVLWFKRWTKGDVRYDISAQIDSLTPASSFLRDFFQSFTPADSMGRTARDADKIALLLKHFSSGDSIARRRAIRGIDNLELDSSHLTAWKNALQSLNWKEKEYLKVKNSFIGKIADIKSHEASDLLVELFHAAGDTLELQNTALETLLRQRTRYSYRQFREILSNEPPIIESSSEQRYFDISLYSAIGAFKRSPGAYASSQNDSFFDELTDSLELTKEIVPDLLPLLNLHEYKKPVMELLTEMIDSNFLRPSDYEAYFNKFLMEARMEYRKQVASVRQRSMEKARKEEEGDGPYTLPYYNDPDNYNSGNIPEYLKLLIPFWNEKQAVPAFINQMLRDGETPLKFEIASILLERNKAVPDSLLDTLARDDKFRYRLYRLLRENKQEKRFPAKYFNHQDLARSQLMMHARYTNVDSIVYLDRLPATEKNKKGFVYFFKYTEEKTSNLWKIATVGLIPTNPKEYEWAESGTDLELMRMFSDSAWPLFGGSDWTELGDTRLLEDEPVRAQLEKQLRKLNVGMRRSGLRFYSDSYSEY